MYLAESKFLHHIVAVFQSHLNSLAYFSKIHQNYPHVVIYTIHFIGN